MRALIEPMIPPPKRGGRRREVNVREVVNAIVYVLSTNPLCESLRVIVRHLPPAGPQSRRLQRNTMRARLRGPLFAALRGFPSAPCISHFNDRWNGPSMPLLHYVLDGGADDAARHARSATAAYAGFQRI